ncbi:MAG TPA: LytTR family DNA-binding domain-containing protein, partial [Terriglobales bacterium]|nr:LytTR family DNA-binding domain-containing protein [Terriglobales bacterium]
MQLKSERIERKDMLRVLVVDDEPLCREALSTLLEERADIAEHDVACDGVDALNKLSQSNYDVLLLDITMPELSGLEVVDRLQETRERLPTIIFITAHTEHAIAAFDRHALDYIVKPFVPDRVNEAIDRATQVSAASRTAALMDALAELRSVERSGPRRIAVKTQNQIMLVDPTEIFAVVADGNYVLLHRKNGSSMVRDSISSVAEKLEPYGFVRIHRSVLVNSSHVEHFSPLFSGEYSLTMRGGQRFTVSRTYKKNLRLFAGLGIGSESF